MERIKKKCFYCEKESAIEHIVYLMGLFNINTTDIKDNMGEKEDENNNRTT